MTSQQLIEARAALWHHNAQPILTLEEAASWVATTGFLLFLPRRQQLRAPSPTFVEATMGTLEHTPARPEIENALSLAHRLFDSGEVFPLNLLGTLNEEPDFLIARDRLPWLLSLRGDRAWKAAPGGRTSPLNIGVWKLLDEQGELTAEEIRHGVGREVSDASIRRALIDLWGNLRVFPHYQNGGETTWTLAKTLCPRECTKGATTAQGAALSLFLADYLRSAIAVTEDEITSFLSPLASRSKLREVLHALVATRQLSTLPLGPNTLYYVEGELPEFPEIAVPAAETAKEATAEAATETGDSQAPSEAAPVRHIRKYTPRTESRKPYERRESSPSRGRPERSNRPAARGGFKPRSEGGYKPRKEGGFKPAFRKARPASGSRSASESRSAETGRSDSSRPERAPRSKDRPARKSTGKPGGFSKSAPRTFSKGPGKSFGKTSGSGPKKSFGKGPGKSPGKGFAKGPKKPFSKGPGKRPAKGFSKSPKRGPGKPRRSE